VGDLAEERDDARPDRGGAHVRRRDDHLAGVTRTRWEFGVEQVGRLLRLGSRKLQTLRVAATDGLAHRDERDEHDQPRDEDRPAPAVAPERKAPQHLWILTVGGRRGKSGCSKASGSYRSRVERVRSAEQVLGDHDALDLIRSLVDLGDLGVAHHAVPPRQTGAHVIDPDDLRAHKGRRLHDDRAIIRQWLAERHYADTTVLIYGDLVADFLTRFPSPLVDIGPDEIIEFFTLDDNGEPRRLAPNTLRRYRTTLRAFFKWAWMRGLVPNDLAYRTLATVDVGYGAVRTGRWLLDDEARALLAACRDGTVRGTA